MKNSLIFLLVLGFAASANATTVIDYGWEDDGTVLNVYPDPELPSIIATNVSPSWDGDQVYEGSYSLRLEYNALTGTPQAFVAYLWSLNDGQEYRVGFWRYDDTPGELPAVRIWAHWNDHLPDDPFTNDGDAGGNENYGSGQGWDYTDWSWTVQDGHTGLVIEARLEGEVGDAVWLDNLHIELPFFIEPPRMYFQFPGPTGPIENGVIAVERHTWSGVKAMYR